MNSIKEIFSLCWIRLSAAYCEWKDLLYVIFTFYPNKLFFQLDLLLAWRYFFYSPYRISREYLEQKNALDLYQYGETPLKSFVKIIKHISLQPNDRFFEIGAGRGRIAFWMAIFKKVEVVGIERIPLFVSIANKIAQQFCLSSVSFVCRDILDVDYTQANCIYICGTCFEEEIIYKLIHKKFNTLKSGTCVITVSYSLLDYTENNTYRIDKEVEVTFPWGKTVAYIQYKL